MQKYILSYNNREDVMQLPVNPQGWGLGTGHNNETFSNFERGDMKLIGRTGLKHITIESFFPNQTYPFCTYKPHVDPWSLVHMIKKWKGSNRPIRLIITETDINDAFAIENFTYEQRDGTGDIYYTLELSEYRFLNVSEVGGSGRTIDKDTGLRERPVELEWVTK
ncbi:hypothetical protein EUAN_12340 [Andreesenia angusta]|uniref:Phage-like element PBSX protein XkdM n=1 Tax=Andreesenia angusta TaxID=39480 RepID=A0A1S1V6X7_9FIRM|nr:hypothetical protein [Andreesenia angusta]OHW62165.1 hypothetical protein EUAN_12340 [Andreesenia angusta]